MLPFVLPLAQWGIVSAGDFARRFKDPLLRRAIPLMFGWSEIPMMAGMAQLAYMHTRNAGFPVGGSLAFARAIEQRYLALGGQIHYQAQVEKILVADKRAIGVRLYNDDTHYADHIISAADGRGTIYALLDGQFTNRHIDGLYDGHLPIHSIVLVSLGVDCDLADQPHWTTYLLDDPIFIAGEEQHDLSVKYYCFDASLAPVGKSAVEVMLPSSYDYWQRIYGHRLYKTEQTQVAEIVTAELERRYPGLRAAIEVSDVATPISYERYTGNWRGSTCGWLLNKETMRLMLTGVDQTLPGLENFYLAGQWVEPGGSLPLAAASGRKAVQFICHADGRPFETSLPEHAMALAG
jgi:phytoene dehydrogenase-like protein